MRLPRLFNRRQKLIERLCRFTEASATLPKTPQQPDRSGTEASQSFDGRAPEPEMALPDAVFHEVALLMIERFPNDPRWPALRDRTMRGAR